VFSASLLGEPLGRAAVAASGDRPNTADQDFATAMILHHEAEIDLAQSVMQRGTDADIRKLAQVVSATHRRQLAFLKAWLAENTGSDSRAYPLDRNDP
jgi:uncharacterized protein (DUF305 family)